MEEVEIVIGSDGQVTVRTIGITGPPCVELGELLAELVGRETRRQLTNDYFAVEGPSRHVRTTNTRRPA